MKVLVNASNIKLSGALQVTISFLEEITKINDVQFIVVVSEAVDKQISAESVIRNKNYHKIDFVLPLFKGYRSYIKSLNLLVFLNNVDCVLSIFGPTYWTPKVTHVAGFAYPWIINPDSEYLKKLSFKKKIKLFLENKVKGYFFKRNSEYFITETFNVKNRLAKCLKINDKNIFVVSNTFNHFFNNPTVNNSFDLPSGYKLLTISSNFEHKNLKIFKDVLCHLLKQGIEDVFFILTINDNDYQLLFDDQTKNIINLGKIESSKCPSLYEICDSMILPSFLECFSATYPEAMKMEKPILTSDLDFAKEICGKAAIYFNPFDAIDIANKIIMLRENTQKQLELIEFGKMRVMDFPSSYQRAEQYVNICKKVVSKINESE